MSIFNSYVSLPEGNSCQEHTRTMGSVFFVAHARNSGHLNHLPSAAGKSPWKPLPNGHHRCPKFPLVAWLIQGVEETKPAQVIFYHKDIIDGHALVGINEGIFKHTCSKPAPNLTDRDGVDRNRNWGVVVFLKSQESHTPSPINYQKWGVTRNHVVFFWSQHYYKGLNTHATVDIFHHKNS